ncbi:hypothetical protein EVAR_41869_1 [Eumeta japonica]|uniref:Uncharacterized protein n=1 Tax=Eumeta variegata TaxID=151549 RepID=A0A4C1X8N7_EUMVA|nr:hypothetical protein EVAR_41869_1 [Eumeta japonica]
MTPTPRTRFLYCIPVERTATTLGYFQASIAVACILIVIRFLIMELHAYIRFTSYSHGYMNYDLTFMKNLSWALLILGLCLTMAVFLLVGIEKRRSGYVLTYLIFGVLGTLALAVGLVILCTKYHHFIDDGGVEMLLVIIVYSLSLTAAYFVYRNIKLEKSSNKMINNELQESVCNVEDV